jgi:hypothetical protein
MPKIQPGATYPAQRRKRGEMPDQPEVMVSARIEESLYEYIHTYAYIHRTSKQSIIREALMLFKERYGTPEAPARYEKAEFAEAVKTTTVRE